MADGRKLKAISTGDLEIDLPNGSKQTQVTFEDAIHSPEMAFTLISISKLDKAKFKVVFHNRMCTVNDPKGKKIAIIPHSDGLFRIENPKPGEMNNYAAIASGKIST